jgi:hypothetical protein
MPTPEKYNNNIAKESNNCVSGSVEGVKIAPKIVDTSITYRHAANICLADTKFNNPNKICIIGI